MTPDPPVPLMAAIPLWSLAEDSLVEFGDAGAVAVVTRWGEHEFRNVSEPVREALRRMALGPVPLLTVVPPGSTAWVGLSRLLDELAGAVVHSLGTPDGRLVLLSVRPVIVAPHFLADRRHVGRPVRMSRFSVLRPTDGGMLLESASARFQVLLLHPSAIGVVAQLATCTTVERVAAATGLPAELVVDVVGFLVGAGVVVVGDDMARFREDEDPYLALWDHDALLFHQHSRTWPAGRGSERKHVGAAGRQVVKPRAAGPTVRLPRPALSDLAADPTLTSLLESDHHCPIVTERPIALRRLGELLYRAVRVRSVGQSHLPANQGAEATQRPYYSVGLVYELEIYLSINRCTGVDRGIYHYDPLRHTVTLINDDPADLDAMLDVATVAGEPRQPSALVTVAARMPLVGRLFGGAGYATTLWHFGALQQVMYLTGKAMGLSAYAVPVDASDRVDRALKLDWPAEVGIGEIVLDAEW